MLKICAAVQLATSISAGTANARGGVPAESMPGTNFTNMPIYRSTPVERLNRVKPAGKHARRQRTSARDD
jgi:hypothetical protein